MSRTFGKYNKITKRFKAIRRRYKREPALSYLTFFVICIGLQLGLTFHGIVFRDDARFDFTLVYEQRRLSDAYQITVTNLAFNPENRLHRMDVYITTTGGQTVDFFFNDLDAEVLRRNTGGNRVEVEVVRVTDHFFIIYTHNVNVGFEIMQTNIQYTIGRDNNPIIHPIVTGEAQSVIDDTLIFETDMAILLPYALHNDIRVLNLYIENLHYQIEDLYAEIEINNVNIGQTEEQMEWQVGNELSQSRIRVESLTNQNTNLENDIRALDVEIENIIYEIEQIQNRINEL